MKPARCKTWVLTLTLLALPACGGSSNRPLDPSGANLNPAAPAQEPPAVTAGTGTGDTPITSGAGDAVPEHAH